jgi:hydroxymethylpyrimidine pyrophosphatase-like HAD family hydrolase
MKFSVLALDYDNTIARDGRAHPAVLEAIREARARQIVIVLVTGRIMSDLRRVLAEQGLFDAIVAENGAVLAFPSRRTRLLGDSGTTCCRDQGLRPSPITSDRFPRIQSYRQIARTDDASNHFSNAARMP